MKQKAYQILQQLNDNRYQAYLVGGCVRDELLKIEPTDFDIATSATPDQVMALFSHTKATGVDYGTVSVIIDNDCFEVTTFRKDYDYTDSRRPKLVTYANRIEDDLARRDFTINAMAFHPQIGLIDPYNGERDLKQALLRCVGYPLFRLKDDALRILRGYRLVCQLHLKIDEWTSKAMILLLYTIHNLSSERVIEELRKLLAVSATFEDYQLCTPLFIELFPLFKESVHFDQANPHHLYSLEEHVYRSMELASSIQSDLFNQYPLFQAYAIDLSDLRLVLLLHDIAKPMVQVFDEQGIAHYLHHDEKSAEIADDYLKELKYPKKRRERIVSLIRLHQNEFSLNPNKLRKTVSQLGIELCVQLLVVKLCDNQTHRLPNTRIEKTLQVCEQLSNLLKQPKEVSCLSIKDMALDGHDVMEVLNMEASVQIKQILDKMHLAILNNEVENKKPALKAWLEKQV